MASRRVTVVAFVIFLYSCGMLSYFVLTQTRTHFFESVVKEQLRRVQSTDQNYEGDEQYHEEASTRRPQEEIVFKDVVFEYKLLRRPRNEECTSSVSLASIVAVILSNPGAAETRQAIRATWAGANMSEAIATRQATFVFIVGSDEKNETLNNLVLEEADVFGDLVVTDTVDNYANLVYKVLIGMKWMVEECPLELFLKVDHDVLFSFDRLIHYLPLFRRPKPSIFCQTWKNMKPYRAKGHKWYISLEQFSGARYPEFCSGPAYIMTRDAASNLLHRTDQHLLTKVEDVFLTGIIAAAANVTRVNLPRMFIKDVIWPRVTYCDREGVALLLALHHKRLSRVEIEAGFKRFRAFHCVPNRRFSQGIAIKKMHSLIP